MDAESRLPISGHLSLDPEELSFSFIRASGPGGQNVNKVATAVQMRFNARLSPSLPDTVAVRALRLAGRRATTDGEIVITAQRFRTQEANRKDAVERLLELLREAAVVPKKRVATRPTKASRHRRLEKKKHRSSVKQGRSGGGWE